MIRRYTVACYYFPNYHVDSRNVLAHAGADAGRNQGRR